VNEIKLRHSSVPPPTPDTLPLGLLLFWESMQSSFSHISSCVGEVVKPVPFCNWTSQWRKCWSDSLQKWKVPVTSVCSKLPSVATLSWHSQTISSYINNILKLLKETTNTMHKQIYIPLLHCMFRSQLTIFRVLIVTEYINSNSMCLRPRYNYSQMC
jgi:hypothetical protein